MLRKYKTKNKKMRRGNKFRRGLQIQRLKRQILNRNRIGFVLLHNVC